MKYLVDTTDVHNHIIWIKGSFKAQWDNPVLEMPVWSPGSYLVRDYSRMVLELSASVNDHQVKASKVSKNQWKIPAIKDEEITIEYGIYAFELTVRTSYLDDRYALISPGSVFFYISDGAEQHNKENALTLEFELPESWELFTSLHQIDGRYTSENFDELVDSPMALAHPETLESTTYTIDDGNGNEVLCVIALIGFTGNQDIEEFKENMVKLQQKSIEMFGELPYDRYLWALYVVGSGGGGLEHKFSNFSIIPRWYFDKNDKKNFARLMSLESHEHFHTYNIKRIRPRQLGPFDYAKEVYTTLLWMAEGITSFYDNVLLPRSNIIEELTYWEIICDDIKRLEYTEGRKIVSLSEASFDAWIKLYKPHEGLSNLYVSYYLKGGLVSLLLDLEIREQTNWEKSLDNAYHAMYQEYKLSPDIGFDENELRSIIERHTGTSLDQFWEKYIDGTEELDYNQYLSLMGYELQKEVKTKHPWFGIDLENNKQNVKLVHRGSPATNAGIYTNDKIISINGYEVTKSTFDIVMKNISSDKELTIHLFRDGILREVTLKPEEPRVDKFKIIDIEEVSEEQLEKREKFFHQSNQN